MKKWIVLYVFNMIFGLIVGRGLPTEETAPPLRVQQCREGCLEKFVLENVDCMKRPECAAMDLSDKINNYIPEALRFLCLDNCRNPPAAKTHRLVPGAWPLEVTSMTRQGSIVSVDLAWEPSGLGINSITIDQCLVTWEVSGGGLMGNLLTDVFTVELSLWPETHYDIRVTCENKKNGLMTRSIALTINTKDATPVIRVPTMNPTPQLPTIAHPTPVHNHFDDLEESAEHDDFNLENNDIVQTHTGHMPTVIHSKIYNNKDEPGAWSFNETRRELAIGAIASVFLFGLLAILIQLTRTIRIPRTHRMNDKQGLIDNEIFPETRTLHV